MLFHLENLHCIGNIYCRQLKCVHFIIWPFENRWILHNLCARKMVSRNGFIKWKIAFVFFFFSLYSLINQWPWLQRIIIIFTCVCRLAFAQNEMLIPIRAYIVCVAVWSSNKKVYSEIKITCICQWQSNYDLDWFMKIGAKNTFVLLIR